MITYYVPLVVDQNYNELLFNKQVAIGLLNIDLDKKERITKASIVGWPILLKKLDQEHFLVLDETMNVVSKITKGIYPSYKDISKEISSINEVDDLLSKLNKLELEQKSIAEISLAGLLNLDINQLIKVIKNKQFQLTVLNSKISDHDIRLITETLTSLKTEAYNVLTSLELLMKTVDDKRLELKQKLLNKIDEVNKKYNDLINKKSAEIEAELQTILPEISEEVKKKLDQVVLQLVDLISKYTINNLKYESGIADKIEVDNVRKELENTFTDILNIKDEINKKYSPKLKEYKSSLDNLRSEKNSEIDKINKKIKELEDTVNNFRNKVNKAKNNIESFITYVESFYQKLDFPEDIVIIIPFLIVITNKNRKIVIIPQIYKGKVQGVFSKFFKKSDLSIPFMNSLQIFAEYLKLMEFQDNIKIYAREINEALKEIENDGWKSKESIDEIYES
ncbi:MAG: hypothetical protein RRA45_05370 [Saccharolobus sp.]|jgi:hypothetical protein|uniref:coiled-coil domain-containing protein n=1 Tax=Saccharolobus sp. TaxID=2100761 RepID=UPI0028CD6A0A|nr:hypothetical protein [Saccharolobus sp.]MDT7861622.1 hypothetical protein [Saccharolobus sp.]